MRRVRCGLNQGLGQLDHWNEETIEARAKKLGERGGSSLAMHRSWLGRRATSLQAEANDGRLLHRGSSASCSLDRCRRVFEAFRKQVLALDPCVTEEFLKLYVAYKAETNFVDVVPQAKRLRLSLNMAFPEINDPRGICKDVTGLGRWGNGDVEVGLSSIEELPYILGLFVSLREADGEWE